jgi:hypothetical protein
MTTPYEKIQEQAKEVLEKYSELNSDGQFSFADGLNLSLVVLGDVIRFLSDYAELDYDKRKATAIDIVNQFYAEKIAPMDIPGVPNIIEPLIDSSIQQFIPVLIGALYDSIHTIVIKA